MRITNIEIRNIKSIESLDLTIDSQVTFILGDNASGKTTILNAIEFALTGSIDDNNRNGDIFKIYARKGCDNMSASIYFDSGISIYRGISKVIDGEKTAYKSFVSYKNGIENLKNKKADEAISVLGVDKYNFDFSKFVSPAMSASKRKEMLLSKVSVADIDFDYAQQYISNHVDDDVKQSDFYTKYLNAINKKFNVNDAYEKMCAYYADANAENNQNKAAVPKLAELKREVDANINLKSELIDQKQTHESNIKAFEDQMRVSAAAIINRQADQTEIKRLQDQIDEINQKSNVDIDQMRKELSELKLIDYSYPIMAHDDIDLKQNMISDLKENLIKLRFESNYSYNGDEVVCPHTDSICQISDTVKQIMIDKSDAAKESAEKAKEIEGEIDLLRDQISKAKEKRMKHNAIIDEIDESKRQNERRIMSLENQIALQEEMQRNKDSRIKEAEEKIDEIKTHVYAGIVDADLYKDMIASETESLAEIKGQLDLIQEKELAYKMQANVTEKLKASTEKLKVCKQIKLALSPNGIQTDLLYNALKDVNAVVNQMCSVLLDREIYYYADGKTFEIGLTDGNVQVPFEGLSGYEQFVFSVAILAALNADADYNIVAIDELSVIYQSNIDKFADALNAIEADVYLAGALSPQQFKTYETITMS